MLYTEDGVSHLHFGADCCFSGDMTTMHTAQIPFVQRDSIDKILEENEPSSKKDHSSISRFKEEFAVISAIGRGGFGSILLCKHRWDGMQYAVGIAEEW